MANWGQLLSKFIPTRTPITRSVLGRVADPAMFQQRLGQTLSRRDFMPKQQYDLDQKDVQLGSLWAKLKSISPDLFKLKSDQAAAIGKNNTGIITDNLPLAPPGKVSRTGKPFQKKTGGLVSALSSKLMPLISPLIQPSAQTVAKSLPRLSRGAATAEHALGAGAIKPTVPSVPASEFSDISSGLANALRRREQVGHLARLGGNKDFSGAGGDWFTKPFGHLASGFTGPKHSPTLYGAGNSLGKMIESAYLAHVRPLKMLADSRVGKKLPESVRGALRSNAVNSIANPGTLATLGTVGAAAQGTNDAINAYNTRYDLASNGIASQLAKSTDMTESQKDNIQKNLRAGLEQGGALDMSNLAGTGSTTTPEQRTLLRDLGISAVKNHLAQPPRDTPETLLDRFYGATRYMSPAAYLGSKALHGIGNVTRSTLGEPFTTAQAEQRINQYLRDVRGDTTQQNSQFGKATTDTVAGVWRDAVKNQAKHSLGDERSSTFGVESPGDAGGEIAKLTEPSNEEIANSIFQSGDLPLTRAVGTAYKANETKADVDAAARRMLLEQALARRPQPPVIDQPTQPEVKGVDWHKVIDQADAGIDAYGKLPDVDVPELIGQLQKKTGGLVSTLGKYVNRGIDLINKTSPARLVASSPRAKTLSPKLQSVLNNRVVQFYTSPVTVGAGAAALANERSNSRSVPDDRITSTYRLMGNSAPLFRRAAVEYVPGQPNRQVDKLVAKDTVSGRDVADLAHASYKPATDAIRSSFTPSDFGFRPTLSLAEQSPRAIAYHELAHRFDSSKGIGRERKRGYDFEPEIPAMVVENATAMRNGWSPQQPSWVYDHMKKHGPQIQNNVQEDIPQIKSFMEQLRGDTELGRRYKDYLDAQGALKKTGSVARGLFNAFMKQLNPVRLAGNALMPVPIKGSLDFAKDVGKYKAGTLTGGRLPLTNSSIKNIAIPTVTGVAVDQALPDDWMSKMFGDWNRKVIRPLGKDLSAWLNRPARSMISAR